VAFVDLPNYDETKTMIQRLTGLEYKALFSLFYATGCRVGEINQIKQKHCSFEEIEGKEVFLIKIFTEKNKIQRIRICPINPVKEDWLVDAIERHCSLKPPEKLLFSYSTRWINKLSHQKFGFNPHRFRHIRATHLMRDGWTNSQLKQFFGWASDKPLNVYSHLNWQDLIPKVFETRGGK
jgi:integrase